VGFGHPENSLKALRQALTSNVHGIELDLRLTKDHKWVVMHNPFFKGEEQKVLKIHQSTLSRLRREVLPLDTALALIATDEKKTLFLDVKDVGEEKQILKMLENYGLLDRTIIISWEPEVLRRVYNRNSGVKLGFSYVPIASGLRYIKGSISKPLTKYGVLMSFNALHSFDAKHKVGKTQQHFLSDLPDLPLYSIQIPQFLCNSALVSKAHNRGFKVFPFNVNSRLTYLLAKRRGADGVLTNTPFLFVE
jgi:glycerophosphoryl diester phosphodiesterase